MFGTLVKFRRKQKMMWVRYFFSMEKNNCVIVVQRCSEKTLHDAIKYKSASCHL